ncbi:MAG TPA: crossover junction endodeoxyribonuclease RuvC [Bacteroidia bacterium]|nr:crossover junction endodeoxyribonuclease RuvC [Bacteroidia bacterium]
MHSPKTQQEKIILGIDPGTNVMGYGVISVSGQKMKLIDLGVVRMEKNADHTLKLKKVFESTVELLEKHLPDEFAVEAPFFGKNVQSMLKLGRAQGVAIAAALTRDIPIFEYSPKKIKLSITGNGNASKEQVGMMLQRLLVFRELPEYLDATDGLAAAVCHFFQGKKESSPGKKHASWNSFISENPGRVQVKK